VETVAVLLAEGTARLRASGSESARLDAELLLADAVGTGRVSVVAHHDAVVGEGAAARFRAAIERRAAGEPVAYIRGLKEFYGLAYQVDRRALIPRPETERLVEFAVKAVIGRLQVGRGDAEAPLRVVDVGTGSGAIAIALAVEFRKRRASDAVAILATDRSPVALDLARENAVGHAVADRITFVATDLLPPEGPDAAPYDLVLANLPYVRHDAMADLPVATSFEPVMALDGGADGLELIRRLLVRLPTVLTADGETLLEIGADQGEDIVAAVADILPGWSCSVERDLAGLPRVGLIRRV
jgi:release factor glutamine methyltransferase